MKKKPVYIIVGVVALIAIISLCYISYHAGEGFKTGNKKEIILLKNDQQYNI